MARKATATVAKSEVGQSPLEVLAGPRPESDASGLSLYEYLHIWLANHEWHSKANDLGKQSWELVAVLDGGEQKRSDGPSGEAMYRGVRCYWRRRL